MKKGKDMSPKKKKAVKLATKALKLRKKGISLKDAWAVAKGEKTLESVMKKVKMSPKKKQAKMSPKKKQAIKIATKVMKLRHSGKGMSLKEAWDKVKAANTAFGVETMPLQMPLPIVCPDGFEFNPMYIAKKDQKQCIKECRPGFVRDSVTNDCKREYKPCNDGLVRDPVTNRCKRQTPVVREYKPCKDGLVRDPVTNRCKRQTPVVREYKPCKDGLIRNPETNRCIKPADLFSGMKILKPGYEINPETGRQRKILLRGQYRDEKTGRIKQIQRMDGLIEPLLTTSLYGRNKFGACMECAM